MKKRTQVVLAAAAHVPLGNDQFLLSINLASGDDPSMPLLRPIMGALTQDRKSVGWLKSLGATSFHRAKAKQLTFMLPDEKLGRLRAWFRTGLDREPGAIYRILGEHLPGVAFGEAEPVCITRRDTWGVNGQKVITLIDVIRISPTDLGRRALDAMIGGNTTSMAIVTRSDIEALSLPDGQGGIDSLAREMLAPCHGVY